MDTEIDNDYSLTEDEQKNYALIYLNKLKSAARSGHRGTCEKHLYRVEEYAFFAIGFLLWFFSDDESSTDKNTSQNAAITTVVNEDSLERARQDSIMLSLEDKPKP